MNNSFKSFWINDEILIEDTIISINTITDWIYDEFALVLVLVYPYNKVLIQFGSIEEMLDVCNRIGSKLNYG